MFPLSTIALLFSSPSALLESVSIILQSTRDSTANICFKYYSEEELIIICMNAQYHNNDQIWMQNKIGFLEKKNGTANS